MRRVIVEKKYGSASADVGTEGVLLMWGTEADDGGTNTVAIIERDDGVVVYAAPYAIRFLEPSVVAAKLAATPAGIARACGMENEVEEAQEVSVTVRVPDGYRREPVGGKIIEGKSLILHRPQGAWSTVNKETMFQGDVVLDTDPPIANPIEVAP